MAPDIHVNFRLRGVPHDCQSRSEVRELVGRVLPVESGTLIIHSLAVNPTERTSRIATLTFNNIPHPLSDKTKDQWVFDLPRSDSSDDDDAYARRRQLVFDTHFSGFTPLQHTEEDDCRVDLIALSGLGGHAFGSFKERNGSFMWLRDALTIDIPMARMMIYGYDTSLVRSISFQNLANLGRALQADLKIIRNSNRGRPIIFVGHSLGGLVLKEAIIKMKEGNTDEDCEILQSTSAFLFFGVPHEGMAIESLVPLVGDQPNRALLESLGKNSEVLHRLQDDFKRAFGAVGPKIVSYFETEKSPTAQKVVIHMHMTGLQESR
ncbi:hypothetical protein DBV05_g1295 [Lasiodiplodia theobromae]|uniref:DUF676 domain-containing protein n=1 Tax=Lasiodiplodia theobromae TaxID=45133 RepID=A0A5N5DRD3_9PEZI|nr:hypothetical protein DBV05_g1295 [Lasiodiplodia theobromae]